MSPETTTLSQVKEYYGQTIKQQSDLKTDACCPLDSFPPYLKEIRELLPKVIKDKFYGCGSPIPLAIEGCRVLDLGCGTGHDVFLLSKLVGPKGEVLGVDMTEEQLAVANEHAQEVSERLGFPRPHTQFLHGTMEDLSEIGIETNSMDVVISNCVINLSPDKDKVFSEIFRVLKPGGELLFADIFSDRRIPIALKSDTTLVGECLAGALYMEDFRRILSRLGCSDFRTVSKRPLQVNDHKIKAQIGNIQFSSATIRAFKLNDLEDRCEDYGQIGIYQGTIPYSLKAFLLDDHHLFEKGRRVPICGNTASMLSKSRYGNHFKIHGDHSSHFGLFDCSPIVKTKDLNTKDCC